MRKSALGTGGLGAFAAAALAALALGACDTAALKPAASTSSDASSSDKVPVATLRDIHAQVIAMYPLAKATADGTDLVTPGAVVVLKKDNLLMNQASQHVPAGNTYTDGKIGPSGFIGNIMALNSQVVTDGSYRTFVTGEKMWITRLKTAQDRVVLTLLSDPYNGERYHATLEIPYPKDSTPSADIALNAIGEVISVDSGQAAAAPAPAPVPVSAAAPAAAPTQTIALGQTKDQVVAALGAPTKVVQLPGKEIDYFPGLKVTFVQGRVSDVQ